MKIILDNDDMQKALYNHIVAMGISVEGKYVSIKVSRGGKGHMATVDIIKEIDECAGEQVVSDDSQQNLDVSLDSTVKVEDKPDDVEPYDSDQMFT